MNYYLGEIKLSDGFRTMNVIKLIKADNEDLAKFKLIDWFRKQPANEWAKNIEFNVQEEIS